jgi:hypothetical protein
VLFVRRLPSDAFTILMDVLEVDTALLVRLEVAPDVDVRSHRRDQQIVINEVDENVDRSFLQLRCRNGLGMRLQLTLEAQAVQLPLTKGATSRRRNSHLIRAFSASSNCITCTSLAVPEMM